MKLTDIFDEIICMCYDKRQDQWPYIESFIHQRGGKLRKIICGDGEILDKSEYFSIDTDPPLGYNLRRQGWNYFRAVKKLFNEYRKKDIDSILFLEDDIQFSPGFDDIFSKAFTQLQNNSQKWDMVYFGYSLIQKTRALQIYDNVLAFTGRACGMHCVGIHRSMFDKILSLDEESYIDVGIGEKFHNTLNCFGIYPQIATQETGFSYNAQKVLDKTQKMVTKKKEIVDVRKTYRELKAV